MGIQLINRWIWVMTERGPVRVRRPDSGKPWWKDFWDELPEEDRIEIIEGLQFILPVAGVASVIYLFYRLGFFDPPERTDLPYRICKKVKTGFTNSPIYKVLYRKKLFPLYKRYLPIYKKRYKRNRKRVLKHWRKNRKQYTKAYFTLGAVNFVVYYLFYFEIVPRS